MGKTALIIEGGGLRGVFASGVLEAFLESGVSFDHVYGVSAGASNAVTYLAGQEGRNKRVFIDYVLDPRYMGFRSWLKTGNFFNKEFIFERIPNELDPFDYETFSQNPTRFTMPVTDAHTGETLFLKDFSSAELLSKSLKAATAIPILAKPEPWGNANYYDGGISCPLIFDSVDFSQYHQVVYILTQPKGYQKLPSKHPFVNYVLLRKYPNIVKALANRHKVYNQTLNKIETKEEYDTNFNVIRPDDSITISRTEKDATKLLASYELGLARGREFVKQYNLVKEERL